MDRKILRQIKDIQVQADHLIKSKPTMDQIHEFSKYSNETKSYLLANLDEEMILSHARQIPNIDEELQKSKISTGIIITLVGIFASIFASYYQERRKVDQALGTVREIQGKYSSIEFLLKNYLD